jgi:hypothetical protein
MVTKQILDSLDTKEIIGVFGREGMNTIRNILKTNDQSIFNTHIPKLIAQSCNGLNCRFSIFKSFFAVLVVWTVIRFPLLLA